MTMKMMTKMKMAIKMKMKVKMKMKMKMIIGIKPKMLVKHKISRELKIMNQRTTATNPIPSKELKMIAKMILHHHPSKILNKPRANPTPNNNRMTPQDKMM